jgi:hypothetical protein
MKHGRGSDRREFSSRGIALTTDPASVEYAWQSLADAIIAHASTLGTDGLAALKAAALASFRSGFEHACFAPPVAPQSVDASEVLRIATKPLQMPASLGSRRPFGDQLLVIPCKETV